jgi:hypothetical protein
MRTKTTANATSSNLTNCLAHFWSWKRCCSNELWQFRSTNGHRFAKRNGKQNLNRGPGRFLPVAPLPFRRRRGKHGSLEAINVMLLNEFLKKHCRMQEVETDLRATIAKQQRQIEALTATVQKVSDQVALRKPATRLVANP